uniref:Calpain 9 n=1 Tax=Sphenodon punctatus TaxID=8508 RepID=A0A8D0GBV5_SPHPU
MPYVYKDSKPQAPPLPQTALATHSSGLSCEELKRQCQQRGTLFEDCDFPANDSSLFFSEKPPIPFAWKRPRDIVKDPQFIVGGATRTDICQGDLGDCWLLAAIASLTLNEKTLARVVPQDQNFGPGYAGIFHFQFWQHNEWLDIVVDDRLPTFKDRLVFLHSADHNEFWSALLEKAYAKLNKSYEALKGGSTIEAMEDFTGGVGEMYEVKKAPENFHEILEKALKRGSMVGCSIDTSSAAESEARTPLGLIKGHAYSITGIEEVSYRGRKVELIRIRNPWGQVEWNGPWSDNSPEWQSISPSEQKRLCQTALDDGEFWMKFGDFIAHFDKVEICNLTPDALDDKVPQKWEVTVHQGSWVRGSTAGGCRNFLETFWTNPQIKLQLKEKDDGQDECTFIAALMQKDRRKLKKLGADMLTIGYTIYESPTKDEHLTKDFFRYHASKARSKTYINLREVSDRFKLPPGDYIIVPTTFEPHQEADFLTGSKYYGNGKLEFNEFKIFWDKLKKWIGIFLHFDSDQSGTMSSYELRTALKAAGFQLNNYLLQLIVLRYSDEHYQIEFDDFLNCLIRLENACREYPFLNMQYVHAHSNRAWHFILSCCDSTFSCKSFILTKTVAII